MANKKVPVWVEKFELGMKDAFDKIPPADNMPDVYYKGFDYASKVLQIEQERKG